MRTFFRNLCTNIYLTNTFLWTPLLAVACWVLRQLHILNTTTMAIAGFILGSFLGAFIPVAFLYCVAVILVTSLALAIFDVSIELHRSSVQIRHKGEIVFETTILEDLFGWIATAPTLFTMLGDFLNNVNAEEAAEEAATIQEQPVRQHDFITTVMTNFDKDMQANLTTARITGYKLSRNIAANINNTLEGSV